MNIEVDTTTEEIFIEKIVAEEMELTMEEKIVGDLTVEENIVDKIQKVIFVFTTTKIITTTIASDKMNQMMKQQ